MLVRLAFVALSTTIGVLIPDSAAMSSDLQSVASRKPRSVLPTVTRRNSIVLIGGIKRNLYLKGQGSEVRAQQPVCN